MSYTDQVTNTDRLPSINDTLLYFCRGSNLHKNAGIRFQLGFSYLNYTVTTRMKTDLLQIINIYNQETVTFCDRLLISITPE